MSNRLSELRTHLLPAKFSPTGTYGPRAYDRTLAYRVLAHAEFESFIEDRALEYVDVSINNWLNGTTVPSCLLALVAYRANSSAEPSSFLNPPQKKSPGLKERVQAARNEYHYYVRTKNNGIKEDNLLRILLPIGITEKEIDQQWLAATEAWATQRGESAHKTGKVQVRPDPQHELRTVEGIKLGFKEIDRMLQ